MVSTRADTESRGCADNPETDGRRQRQGVDSCAVVDSIVEVFGELRGDCPQASAEPKSSRVALFRYSGGMLSRLFFVVVSAVVFRNFRPAEVGAT